MNQKTAATILVSFFVLGLILGLFYSRYSATLSVLITDPLWASVFATIVLVIINAVYILQTRQTIYEMKKAREAEFFPHVRVDLDWLGPAFVLLRCTNFGKGPANNIKAEIVFYPSEEKRILSEAIMAPNEFIRIFLPEGEMEKVCTKSENITIKGEYTNLFGQKFKIDESLSAGEFIEQAQQLHQLVEKNVPREIAKTNDNLEKITTELRTISRALEEPRKREYFKQPKPEDLNPKVLEKRIKNLGKKDEQKQE